MRLDQQDQVTVVTMRAEDCQQLWRTLEPLVEERKRAFVLDLRGVTFLNSVSIAAIIAARNKVAAAGGRLVLANLTDNVKAVFRVLKLERLFDLEFDLTRAAGAAKG